MFTICVQCCNLEIKSRSRNSRCTWVHLARSRSRYPDRGLDVEFKKRSWQQHCLYMLRTLSIIYQNDKQASECDESSVTYRRQPAISGRVSSAVRPPRQPVASRSCCRPSSARFPASGRCEWSGTWCEGSPDLPASAPQFHACIATTGDGKYIYSQ